MAEGGRNHYCFTINRNMGPEQQQRRTATREYSNALVRLGALATFDKSLLASNTLSSIIAHCNLLKRNNIELSPQTFQDPNTTYRLLDSLVGVNNKPLSEGYKRQIAITIQRMFNIKLNLKRFRKQETETRKARLESSDYMKLVDRIVEQAGKVLATPLVESDELGLNDAATAVLLTITTCLRIQELCSLTMTHLEKIVLGESVHIQTKTGVSRNITNSGLLLLIIKGIQRKRKEVHRTIEVMVSLRPNNSDTHKRSERFHKGYVLISSSSYMLKKLKEMAAVVGYRGTEVLGFNLFRKYISSILSAGGGHLEAQAMNGHASLRTTLEYYTAVTTSNAERAFNDLNLEPLPIQMGSRSHH